MQFWLWSVLIYHLLICLLEFQAKQKTSCFVKHYLLYTLVLINYKLQHWVLRLLAVKLIECETPWYLKSHRRTTSINLWIWIWAKQLSGVCEIFNITKSVSIFRLFPPCQQFLMALLLFDSNKLNHAQVYSTWMKWTLMRLNTPDAVLTLLTINCQFSCFISNLQHKKVEYVITADS